MNFAASNFSFFTLFLKADFVVKFVIIILIGKYFIDNYKNDSFHG